MRSHPHLRAYMAGVLLPTWFLLLVLVLFLAAKGSGHFPNGLDRAIIFPMAVVPNVWGLWNVLYGAFRFGRRIPIGAFGAVLPLLLGSAGLVLQSALDLHFFGWRDALEILPVGVAVYYLAWKFGVGFLNRIVDLP